ncbi:uncharacterized protein LOC110870243 [Helianthus annuus]|uniref:uncharacterized protein LOC110870243 n=1 Tax=Helianthus annuus TaxID=4232 RepID=UPI000B8F1DDB|nr:uncharacterized protein LOC110870243 [Helianthus annuus]
MNRACNLGLFKACKLPNNGPLISHFCYADDVIFIGEWTNHNISTLNRLLRWLHLVTGLKVNRQKSKVFGIGVSEAEIGDFAALARCEVGSFPFSYLGIPVGVNMKRAAYWKPVIEKFSSVLSKWKARHLPFAGRLTLPKSVLGSLPSYFLSLFAAPKCIIYKLEKIRRDFLWGKSASGNKMRWLRWDFIIKSIKARGMGLGSIHSFNKAMLSKWWWRFKDNPNQTWAEVIRSIHTANSVSNNSFLPIKKLIAGPWKDIFSVEKDFAKVGINIYKKLIHNGVKWIWTNDPNGSVSVKQVRLDIEEATNSGIVEPVAYGWNSWVPPKVNYLLWKAMLGKVASKIGLRHRGVPVHDVSCPRCGICDEDPMHVYINYLWARSIWWSILTWMRIKFPSNIGSIEDMIGYLRNQPGDVKWKKMVYAVALATVWRIWLARNDKVFNGNFIPVSKSVELINEDTFIWIFNRSKLSSPSWGKWVDFDIVAIL